MQEAKSNLTKVTMSVAIPFHKLSFGPEVAQGSFGTVYRGTLNHAPVAIKELKAKNLTAVQEEEFKREAHLMVKLNAPNIVQCFGVCVDRAPYCIVMEYMPKGSLTAVLKAPEITLSWPTRERIALDIACGLNYLHSENIIHRDLKSLNVLLDNEFKAKICDFGLAKIKIDATSFVMSGNYPKGTVLWMAPELIRNPPQYSFYSDIYSYGFTLWEIASRKMPFSTALNRYAVFQMVSEGKREVIPADCPQKIANLITRCWAQEPKQRPLTDVIINELKAPNYDSIIESLDGQAKQEVKEPNVSLSAPEISALPAHIDTPAIAPNSANVSSNKKAQYVATPIVTPNSIQAEAKVEVEAGEDDDVDKLDKEPTSGFCRMFK